VEIRPFFIALLGGEKMSNERVADILEALGGEKTWNSIKSTILTA